MVKDLDVFMLCIEPGVVDSEDQFVFDGIEHVLSGVASCALLADEDCPEEAIPEGVGPAEFLDVANAFVVEVVEQAVCQVVLVVLEELEPVLKVGNHFPAVFPGLAGSSPAVVPVEQY